MTYRIAAIDIHKNVLMVVVAIAATEVADTAGEALEFLCRQFGTGAQERQHLVSWLQRQQVTDMPRKVTAVATEKIEDFLTTGKPYCPVERTLLTGGVLDAGLESRLKKSQRR